MSRRDRAETGHPPGPAGYPHLAEIKALLGRELCTPLGELEAGLAGLLRDPPAPLTDAGRAHVLMMVGLCDDLRRLTRETLGAGADGDGAPASPAS